MGLAASVFGVEVKESGLVIGDKVSHFSRLKVHCCYQRVQYVSLAMKQLGKMYVLVDILLSHERT